jgi:hypothetical protein
MKKINYILQYKYFIILIVFSLVITSSFLILKNDYNDNINYTKYYDKYSYAGDSEFIISNLKYNETGDFITCDSEVINKLDETVRYKYGGSVRSGGRGSTLFVNGYSVNYFNLEPNERKVSKIKLHDVLKNGIPVKSENNGDKLYITIRVGTVDNPYRMAYRKIPFDIIPKVR